jgi:hypothetical protein
MVAVHTGLLLISVRECQSRSCITLEHLLRRPSPIQLPTPAYLNQPLHSELVSWQRPNIDSLSALVIPRRHRLSLIQSALT